MTELRGWIKDNQALTIFLMTQLVAVLVGGISLVTFSVRMDARVKVLETRGPSSFSDLERRLTTLETKVEKADDLIVRAFDRLDELRRRP